MTPFTVRTHVDWNAEQRATAVLLLRVADAPGQELVHEELEVDNAVVEDVGPRPGGGARPLRLSLSPGPVRLRYVATVVAEQAPVDLAATIPTWSELDLGLLPWTLPSRYCPSDVLAPTAEHLFDDAPRTGELLERVRSWVETNIAYVPGSSNVYTAADETMLRRAGVCRDLAHLMATLLRGLGVPARVVSAYALDLELQDFHAVVEAHDGGAWRLLDPTGLAPVDTLARIATGRDAAEIAWGTTDGPITLERLEVAVARV